MELLTVVCSKWGTMYGPEYVNALQRGVSKYLRRPHRFVCFTDNPTGVEAPCRPIEPWWEGKDAHVLETKRGTIAAGFQNLYLFRKDFPYQGRILYLDLDVVVTGSLDDLVQYKHPFVAIWDWWSNNWNGSVNLFTAGFLPSLWDAFPPTDWTYLANGQDWLLRQVPDGQRWPDAWVRSYKIHCQAGLPQDCRIVVFHGQPKPPDAAAWIKEYWYAK